jgi:hypothetical protein
VASNRVRDDMCDDLVILREFLRLLARQPSNGRPGFVRLRIGSLPPANANEDGVEINGVG